MAFELDMTEVTPQIWFEANEGNFSFTGVLMPEDAFGFFAPLFGYINKYFENPQPETKLEVNLEYFNTSSSRILHQFMKQFTDNQSENTNITIVWKYEADDQEMEEVGEEFKLLFNQITFEMVTIERPRMFEVMG
jgi:hypothetical protein